MALTEAGNPMVSGSLFLLLCWAAGTTYNPDQGAIEGLPGGALDPCLSSLAEVCAACNESKLDCSAGVFKAVGAPTEASLKVGCAA